MATFVDPEIENILDWNPITSSEEAKGENTSNWHKELNGLTSKDTVKHVRKRSKLLRRNLPGGWLSKLL